MEITNKKEMKKWLKEEGALIKANRLELKNTQSKGNYAGDIQWKLQIKIAEYRLRHIAYSLSKGKEYKQIERTVRKRNEPNWGKIDSILVHELAYVLFKDEIIIAKPIYQEEQ